MKNTVIIIPTYNEIDNIQLMIDAVLSQSDDLHLLIVDDNSPDGTGQVVKNNLANYSGRLFLEEREGKQGLGTAYIHGFKWALYRDYEFIFEMDADFSHNPNDIPVLYKACKNEGADLAIGSRYVRGVNVVNWPMSRVLLSYFASKYVRFITRMSIHDTTAGFKCYKASLLSKINLDKIKFVGYAFQIEMKFKAFLLKANIMEVPVIFTDRSRGQSKMSGGIIHEAVTGVFIMKIKSLIGKLEL
ncbi:MULTISPECIES: polyprenol monophosphomannose synthase [Nonlabens]|uniref:Dolichol-phosphate mannosyltransferase n=1 Tax=Nonlabens xylanidelens TaxID=191564 RepID=A0A2S6IRZ0_9FLAO|nr:polyprenol monophosphomannose synthase [Nonlabens xylanidelens]PPK96978.1 dolichol-phosphate mannosyltransferase [Nonlabens xylanidelens]PQJ13671.1 dolichyl-phosphate beta-D-mannosyltransferase [Nonlabens xylanidelens]